MTASTDSVPQPARRAGWVTPAAIGLMLFLRMAVLGLGVWLLNPVPAWLDPFYEVATYLLTLFLIVWERERLEEFHIGWLAVGIILIFKPLETLFLSLLAYGPAHPMAFPSLASLIVWAGALSTLAWTFFARPALRAAGRAEWRWFGLGLLAGGITAGILSVPLALQLRMLGEAQAGGQQTLIGVILSALVMHIPYQLGYAAVSEEPLFRGFLWGYLRRLGWWDTSIWLFQALLFTLSHIYYITRLPYSFWIVLPAGALVLGWLARRSRSIATSMAAHAALNGLGMQLAQMVYPLLFR